MNLAEILLGFAIGVPVGCILCAGFYLMVEKRAQSISMAARGEKGRANRADADDRLSAAIMEAAMLHKAGKTPQEIISELLPKYPEVAFRLGKQLPKLMQQFGGDAQ